MHRGDDWIFREVVFCKQLRLHAIFSDTLCRFAQKSRLGPTPIRLPPGCVFHGRCPHAEDRCRQEIPRLLGSEVGFPTQAAACHAVEEGRI